MQLSPLRYPGGKSKASKILRDFVPADVTSLVSPFFGGGSFENYLALQGVTVRGFDLCDPLVDFWNAYLTRKDEVFARIRAMSAEILQEKFYVEAPEEGKPANKLDPNLRKEQRAFFQQWREVALTSEDAFERGVAYFALNRCAFSGLTLIASPMSTVNIEKKFGVKAIDNLEKVNFQVKSVEHGSCFDVIVNAGTEFLYLDPPYVMETESKEAIYGKDGELHKGFDHVKLAEMLKSYKGQWVLSYLDVPAVREMYNFANITEVTWRYTMKPGGNRPQGKELVITNF
jgi:DNA adenine methylase